MASDSGRAHARFRLLNATGSSEFSAEWRDAMKVSVWLRHASGIAMARDGREQPWIDSYVLGHVENGDRNRRISFVPLPTVGHPHSDCRIRRAMIVDAPEGDGSAVEALQDRLTGEAVTNDESRPVCMLAASDWSGVWKAYVPSGGARVWRSVTPLVLHGHNANRGEISVRKTERLVLQALTESGYPLQAVEGVAFQQAPMWPGAGSARAVRVPAHLERWPRYHVEVRFRDMIRGPVIAGIGRHYGIGLFAARDSVGYVG